MPDSRLMRELSPNERPVFPSDPLLRYFGRRDDRNPDAPRLSFVLSGFCFHVSAGPCYLLLENRRAYWKNYLGLTVNGRLYTLPLEDNGLQKINLTPFLGGACAEVSVFKQMDACHELTFYGMITGPDVVLSRAAGPCARRIEVYGDSVSAGEVTEAIAFTGRPDPEHNGEFSNGYWSFAAQTARLLGAELNCVAQGGIALEDGRGYFNPPRYSGMLSCFDKAAYNEAFGPSVPWDFSRYRPHVVVVALGQNDAHPYDFMRDDPDGEEAARWRAHYAQLVKSLRAVYPRAYILLTTTVLMHEKAWDDAITRVARELNDPRVRRFLYSRNGAATPGHPRVGEQAEMAFELTREILSLGDGVWEDEPLDAQGSGTASR